MNKKKTFYGGVFSLNILNVNHSPKFVRRSSFFWTFFSFFVVFFFCVLFFHVSARAAVRLFLSAGAGVGGVRDVGHGDRLPQSLLQAHQRGCVHNFSPLRKIHNNTTYRVGGWRSATISYLSIASINRFFFSRRKKKEKAGITVLFIVCYLLLLC